MRIRSLALITALVAVLAVASAGRAGGIADTPCPNARGEHTNTCPPGTVGAPYSLRFVESEGAGCGPGRQTFHFDSGRLPPGLDLAPDGMLAGTPLDAGSFRFYVEMREPQDDPATCAGKRTQKEFTVVIRKAPWIAPLPARASGSEVGMPFGIGLRARGGSGGFAWGLIEGRLPPGLRLGRDGSIEGAPRAAGTFRFVAQARDTEARSVTWPATLVVAARLAVATRPLPAAKVGRDYAARLTAAGGVAPTRWRLASGRLPPGIHLTRETGRLAGTPTRTGTFRFAVEVGDRLGATSTRAAAIVVRRARR